MSEKTDSRQAFRLKLLEVSGWIAGVALLWTLDTLTKLAEYRESGIGKEPFRLITEQATSASGVLIMIGFVIYWLRLFPLRRDAWLPAVAGHIVGSMLFAFGHFSIMMALRGMVYAVNDMTFIWRGPFVHNLIVEYQKDIKIYLGIVIIVSAYQYWRSTVDKALHSSADSRKLIVQTGSGEAIVRYDEITRLEASRNYVVVHTAAREYLIRDTIGNIENKLPGHMFARVHRSHIVNIEFIAEMKSIDGSYRIRLHDASEVPLSRSYRDALKSRMTGE